MFTWSPWLASLPQLLLPAARAGRAGRAGGKFREPRSRVGPGRSLRARGHLRRANLVALRHNPNQRSSKPPPQSQPPPLHSERRHWRHLCCVFLRHTPSLSLSPIDTQVGKELQQTDQNRLLRRHVYQSGAQVHPHQAPGQRARGRPLRSNKPPQVSPRGQPRCAQRVRALNSCASSSLTDSLAYRALALSHLERFDEAEKV